MIHVFTYFVTTTISVCIVKSRKIFVTLCEIVLNDLESKL